jgi:hypothetical protein
MIRLKQLLFEMTDVELKNLARKIQSKEFKYIGAGDNGRVYQIDGEDKVFKITTSTDEIEVARKIQNKMTEYSTFIPVYFVGDLTEMDSNYKDVIIMANAEQLSTALKRKIDSAVDQYKSYSYEQGGEVSIFDFVDDINKKQIDVEVLNFIDALRVDVDKLNIPDLDLDLDFKSDNIMKWNGKLVMVDW